MRLYLVQHGLAEDESVDAMRPLAAQGREDVTRTAGFLSLFEKPRPSRIVHSGKLRAQQTAEMFGEAWGIRERVFEVPDLTPGADPAFWAANLANMHEDILLVGHLPHLEKLAGLLICGDAGASPVKLRNGGVLCLQHAECGWQVLWQINPTLFYGE